MKKMIKFPLVLAITGIVCATSLGVVYQITNPIIQERVNAAANEAIGAVLPGAKGADVTNEYKDKKDLIDKYKVSTIYEVNQDGKDIGFGYKLSATGRNGAIEMMVILNDTEILGVKVLSQSETSSYYDKVIQAKYEESFKGAKIEDLEDFDTVTGATLSSKGIKSGVIAAANAHKEIVLGESLGPVEIVKPEEFEKLGYSDSTFEDATEAFKQVQGNAYNTNFVGTGKEKNGITNAYYRKDKSGNVVGYVYYFESVYNCEVSDGQRANQTHRGLFAFDKDGSNTKLVILESGDSIKDIPSEKPEFEGDPNIVPLPEMPWIQGFNGLNIKDIKSGIETLPDHVTGATFTTKALVKAISTICVGHKDF